MKLGLLGFPISHSLSPKLYQRFLGNKLTSYELFSFETPEAIPTLDFFSKKLDGLNITSPYKTHFLNQVIIESPLVQKIGAINTLAFKEDGVYATNTDVLAVEEILKRYKDENPSLHLIILGSGVMAKMTEMVASDLKLSFVTLARKTHSNLSHLDLRKFEKAGMQTLIINACSRDFVFQGEVDQNNLFWDYNYSFLPHQNTLPKRVKSYQDGQEMLELQAQWAIKFWHETTTKLK